MPLDRFVIRIFQREVERQCRFGLLASLDLDQALRTNNIDRIWASVQGLLVAAGNVSKLLWNPQYESIPGRGSELRQSLNVSANSPLEPGTFRNHFERFDERLDEWATSSVRRNFVDSNVGPPGMIGGIADSDFLRNFDTMNYAVTYRGDRYELRPVVAELQTLWTVANREANRFP